jgi:hypothetical protein
MRTFKGRMIAENVSDCNGKMRCPQQEKVKVTHQKPATPAVRQKRNCLSSGQEAPAGAEEVKFPHASAKGLHPNHKYDWSNLRVVPGQLRGNMAPGLRAGTMTRSLRLSSHLHSCLII